MSVPPTPAPSRRTRSVRRWRTLRVRLTIIASLVITAAVIFGLVLLYLLQIQTVRRTLDGQLRTYAQQIAQSATNGTFPVALPQSTLDANAEAQVTTADGHVLAATRALAGMPAVYALPANSTVPVRLKGADGALPGDVIVVGVRENAGGQTVTIVTGTPTSLLTQLRSAFTADLLFGLPVILLLAASAVWLIVGRALRPVEQIRHAVTAITSADLSQRVPDPGTADEIGNLAATMNSMLGRLEDSARRQRRFVSDASHELRSPLSAIRTTLEVGLAHPDRAPWPVIAERAAQQSNRLEELIQQLLLLARADEKVLTQQSGPVDVSQLLQDVAAGAGGGHVVLDLRLTSPAMTEGNAEHLTRVFRNIVDNALRYANSRIRITSSTTDNQITVEIADDGPGIPEAERGRVFERFVRLDRSRERGTGTTGLGLAIAREIATAHDGDIRLTDSPESGACFAVRLPRWRPPA